MKYTLSEDLFEKQYNKNLLYIPFFIAAKKYPNKVALIYEDKEVKYKELIEYVLKIASRISEKSVEVNDRVVISLPRGIDQITTILAVLICGASYVPVGINQPEERKRKIICDVNPKLIIDDMEFLEDNTRDETSSLLKDIDEDTSAYIIYTSGSTGVPKGVEISHLGAMNTIKEVIKRWGICKEDKILNVSSVDFDLSVFDIFALLGVGGTVVLINEEDFRNPYKWKELIFKNNITIWNSAPALLEMLTTIDSNKKLSSLRLALISGDWIPLNLPERWHKITDENSKFISLGGATEASIWSNAFEVEKVSCNWKSIPYGKALTGQFYRIVDEKGNDCDIHNKGELLIGGKGLAKGYVNSLDLTNKKFIKDKNGERLYKTGDLGCFWEDGTIEFLGRKDNQVKIKGHRIELCEIETVLNENKGIKKSVVVSKGNKFNKYLVAYYTGDIKEKNTIVEFLRRKLPEYFIPTKIYNVDKFPLTASGKIDRKGLELLEDDIVFNEEACVSINNLSESTKILKEMWEEILEQDKVSIKDNLFYIGADSLLVTRFVDMLRRRYGLNISLKTVFSNPTIYELDKEFGEDILKNNIDIEEGEI